MIRTFVALALPDSHRFELQLLGFGIGLSDPVPEENLHLTLLFLGELPEPVVEDVHSGLEQIRMPAFELSLAGIDMFGGTRPRTVHVGARDSQELRRLQAKVATAARDAGLQVEARRFVPHVTLARLRPGDPDAARLSAAVAQRSVFTLPPFQVSDFRLYRSRLRPAGAVYEELAVYPLGLG